MQTRDAVKALEFFKPSSAKMRPFKTWKKFSIAFIKSFSKKQKHSALTPDMENEKEKRNAERKKAQKKAQKQRIKVKFHMHNYFSLLDISTKVTVRIND